MSFFCVSFDSALLCCCKVKLLKFEVKHIDHKELMAGSKSKLGSKKSEKVKLTKTSIEGLDFFHKTMQSESNLPLTKGPTLKQYFPTKF